MNEPPSRTVFTLQDGSGNGNFPFSLSQRLASSHLPSIDGIRAIAVMLVVVYHSGLGVLAFFVLSGFLITWLLLKEEERTGTVSLKRFYIRRSLRIFPAFYVYCFLVFGLLLVFRKPIHWPQAIASLFYVNNYYQALYGDPNTSFSHTWSLGIEEQFYLLWPMAFLLVRTVRTRVRLLSLTITGVWIYREVLVFIFHTSGGYIYEALDTRADHLLIGCLLAVLLRARALPNLWRRLCASSQFIFLTIAALIVSVSLANTMPWRYRDVAGFIVDPLLIAILIVQTIAFREAIFSVFLNFGWMRYLGRISYSVYLYQQILMYPVQKLIAPWPTLSIPISVAAVIAVASASYHFVEMPFLRLKNRWSSSCDIDGLRHFNSDGQHVDSPDHRLTQLSTR